MLSRVVWAVAVDAVAAATVAMGSLFWSIVVFVGRVLFGRVLFGRVASVVVVAFAAAAMAMGVFCPKMDRGCLPVLPIVLFPVSLPNFPSKSRGVKWGIFFGKNI